MVQLLRMYSALIDVYTEPTVFPFCGENQKDEIIYFVLQ